MDYLKANPAQYVDEYDDWDEYDVYKAQNPDVYGIEGTDMPGETEPLPFVYEAKHPFVKKPWSGYKYHSKKDDETPLEYAYYDLSGELPLGLRYKKTMRVEVTNATGMWFVTEHEYFITAWAESEIAALDLFEYTLASDFLMFITAPYALTKAQINRMLFLAGYIELNGEVVGD